jgi:hypothetical protein
MLAREFMTTLNDANDAFVADENLMLYAGLATKLEHRASVAHESDMTIAQGRKPEALVIACVFHVADTYTRGIEQHHHGCVETFTGADATDSRLGSALTGLAHWHGVDGRL